MNLIENLIKGLWDDTKKHFKDFHAKEQIEYRTAYEKYLIKTKEKHGKIKTIIYRSTPKELYSFYENIKVSLNGRIISTENINDLIRIGNKLIISGSGGVGKSTLFKHLFLNTITNTQFIPVLLEFRSFSNQNSLEDEIYKSLQDNGFELEREYFQHSLKEGVYVILLDGFDELNRDEIDRISNEIQALTNKYEKNKYIISSRPFEGFVSWTDFCELVPLNLDKKQAVKLIGKIDFNESIKEKFCKELEDDLFEKYQSFASNPLLLTIMLLTFEKHAAIPNKLTDFYENAFVTLFETHDATKSFYKRNIMSKLSCADFKFYFSRLCFQSYFRQETQFSEAKLDEYIKNTIDKFENSQFNLEYFKNDLINSVCMLVKEGQMYRFVHKSFQEYFAAYYTSRLAEGDQFNVVSQWINKILECWQLDETYLEMLFDLESDKFNRIIICPYIRQIKEIYDKTGFSKEFLKQIFAHTGFYDDDKTGRILLCVGYRNNILDFVLQFNKKLNGGININSLDDNSNEDAYYKVKTYIEEHNLSYNPESISFDILSEAITENRMLKELNWIKNNVEFAFEILDKYDKSQNQTRSLTEIIDRL